MTQEEQDIRQATEELISSWNTLDPAQFAASFAPDAQFTDVIGTTVKGRAAIAALHLLPFTRLFQSAQLQVTEMPVQLVSEGVASIRLHWKMHGHTSAHGESLPPRAGIMYVIMVRRDGRWWPVVAHNTDHTATSASGPGPEESV